MMNRLTIKTYDLFLFGFALGAVIGLVVPL